MSSPRSDAYALGPWVIGTMNHPQTPSTALRAPSPPLGEKDGMRGYGSWRACIVLEPRIGAIKTLDLPAGIWPYGPRLSRGGDMDTASAAGGVVSSGGCSSLTSARSPKIYSPGKMAGRYAALRGGSWVGSRRYGWLPGLGLQLGAGPGSATDNSLQPATPFSSVNDDDAVPTGLA